MADDSLLRQGIEAVQAGDRARGRALLSKVVLENPDSEAAWWYLGLSVDDHQHRLYCFKKVLSLNPNHQGARARLGLSPGDASDRAKPAGRARKPARARQMVILVILGLLTLVVLIGGGGYIYLDSSGYLDGSLSEAVSQLLSGIRPRVTATVPAPTQGPAPSPTITTASLSSIPTWTPTASPTRRPPTPTATATFPATPEIPTEQPPTPAALPSPGSGTVTDLNTGTGPLTMFPGDFDVYRFQPSDSLSLQFIATLTFHLLNPDEPLPLTLELYMWNISSEQWEPYGLRWGDNVLPQPSVFVSSEGVVIAAVRHWGEGPIEINNMGFTFSGLTEDGANIYYGLNREIIRFATEQAATPTQEFSD